MQISLDYSTELLNSSLGISCIENHYMAVLMKNDFPYHAVYYKSFIPVINVVVDFMKNGSSYAYYRGLERLQYTGKQLGLAQTKAYENLDFEKVKQMLETELTVKRLPILMRVDASKIDNVADLPWREDHFIMIFGIRDEKVLLMDDFPKRVFEMDFSQLQSAYNDEIILFELLPSNKIRQNAYEQLLIEIQAARIAYDAHAFEQMLESISLDNLSALRDAVGILKISRRRMESLAASLGEQGASLLNELNEANRLTEKLYNAIELYRLRKTINSEFIKQSLFSLSALDTQWLSRIQTNESNLNLEGLK
ncbi:hypothetical protein [Paenibacillus sp. NPDC058071]|uniref:hypothetical protein n=1 Tax=Paenibacillus sp. NPDC058071 TaxID=3346326 RepID=UPI0036D76173